MTREEAIQILRTRIVPTRNWQEIHEAIDMAIEALTERNIARDIATILENEQDMRVMLQNADRPKGEWIEVEDYNGDVHYKCDQCGEEWTFPYGTPKENNANFCPGCGAIMENKE